MKFINKVLKKEYLLVLFMFLAIFSTIIIKPLNDLDEIWNYNVARNISNGLIPYKDISTITTPLLPMINSLFLNIFADELIVMRFLAAALGTAILYMIFKIFRLLTKETNISLIITLLFGILFREIYCIDYNFMVLFFTLLLLYLELKWNKKMDKSNNIQKNIEKIENNNMIRQIFQGVIAGLAVCTKQSIGFLVAVAVVLYPLTQIKSKLEIKQYVKNACFRIIGILIPGTLLILYLLVTRGME